jgi:hypothetical protein
MLDDGTLNDDSRAVAVPTGEGRSDAAQRVLTGTLRQPPLVGVWAMAALLSVMMGGFIFAAILGVLAFLSVQNPSARAQTSPEPPVVAIMLHMEEPLPVRSAAVSALPVQGQNAQQAAAPVDFVAPVVQAGDVTAPGEASISLSPWVGAASQTAERPFTAVEAVSSDLVSSHSVGSGLVQASQVTAPGESTSGGLHAGVGGEAISGIPTDAGGTVLGVRPFAPEPPPVSEPRMTYAQMFQDVAMRYDLDWRMLAAQAYIESGFDALALGNRGSMGLMQIQPQTWREWAPAISAVDPFDSYSNALVAGLYLDYLRRILSDRGYPQTEWMLVAYNWGPDQLLNYLGAGGDWASLPVQVRNYAEDVLRIAQTLPRAN